MSPTLAFGDDRSAGADGCWDWIVGQRWDGWRLEVVTADPPVDFHPVSPEEAELHPWDPTHPRRPVDRGFLEVEYLRAELDPRVALIARPWELVAIGPRGEGWMKNLHLGSTADWLLREPASPLVIARKTDPVRQVLLAADGSAHVQRVTETLVSLPWITDVLVRVLVVDDGHVDVEAAVSQPSATLTAGRVEVEHMVTQGSVTRVIVEEIERSSPDLVAMGARGRSGLKRLVLGSTTAAIAGSTHCSLLVAHAEQEPVD